MKYVLKDENGNIIRATAFYEIARRGGYEENIVSETLVYWKGRIYPKSESPDENALDLEENILYSAQKSRS